MVALLDEHDATVLIDMCSFRCNYAQACFENTELRVSVAVHGDDSVALGTDTSLEMCEASFRRVVELGHCDMLGFLRNRLKEVRFCNRAICIVDEVLRF